MINLGERGSLVRGASSSVDSRATAFSASLDALAPRNSDRFKESIINVAIAPLFARLKGFNDRMLCLMKVLRGVLVLRAIAAANVPADFAETKMNPGVARLQTVFAPACARRDIAYLR